MKEASDIERAQAATVLDCEGTVGIYRVRNRRRTSEGWYVLHVLVTMTDLALVDWLRQTWGGSLHVVRPRNPRAKLQWQWQLSSNQAAAFLAEVRPWLRIKGERADVGLKFQALARSRSLHVGWHQRMPASVRNQYESYRVHLRALNRRGRNDKVAAELETPPSSEVQLTLLEGGGDVK